MYQGDQAQQLKIKPTEGTQRPVEMGEAIDTAWNNASLWSQSTQGENARMAALQDHIDAVQQKTGKNVGAQIDWSGMGMGGAMTADMMLDQVNSISAKDNGPQIDSDQLQKNAIAKSQQAHAEFEAMQGREKTTGGRLGMVVGDIIGSATDKMNLLTLPLAPETAGVSLVAAALRWGAVAALSQGAVDIAAAPYHEQVQPGYLQSTGPFTDVAGAFAGGALLGGATKAIGNAWVRASTGQWPRSIRDAGNVLGSEANVATTNPFPAAAGEAAHRSALQDSIDALIEGRPVNVDQHITPSILASYEGRLAPVMEARAQAAAAGEAGAAAEREAARLPNTMERLSEVQLGEFHTAAEAARTEGGQIADRTAANQQTLETSRGALAQRGQELEAARADVGRLRSEVEAAQARADNFGPRIDEQTQGRLDAIDADLAKPGVTAAQQTELEAERARITETIDKGPTEAEHARQAGSLQTEAKGLSKALDRQEKGLAKLEAKHATAIAALQKSETKNRLEASILPARAQGKIEAARVGLRKSINQLADKRYGLQLPRADAEAMASRVIGASSRTEAEAEIRKITEELVDRRVAARRAAPEALPMGEQAPGAAEAAKADYWTEEMRKRVTALAREVGYEMPREDAAAVAAKLAQAPNEQAALAHLDQLMLHPRNAAEPLPGTGVMREAATEAAGSLERPATVDAAPEALRSFLASPAAEKAVAIDIDRARAMGDHQIPVGVDERGEPVFRSLDSMADEVEAYRNAAKELESCITGGGAEAANG